MLSRPDLAGFIWAHSVFLQEPKNEHLLEGLTSLRAVFWSEAIKLVKSFDVVQSSPNGEWSPPVCLPIATDEFVMGIDY